MINNSKNKNMKYATTQYNRKQNPRAHILIVKNVISSKNELLGRSVCIGKAHCNYKEMIELLGKKILNKK